MKDFAGHGTPGRYDCRPSLARRWQGLRRAWYVIIVLLAACTSALPAANETGLEAVTAVPTLDADDPVAVCAAADNYWGDDWTLAIHALEVLVNGQHVCPNRPPAELRLAEAHYENGRLQQQAGRRNAAVRSFQTTLFYDPLNEAATVALRRLNIFTPQPAPRCTADEVNAAMTAMPEYIPTDGTFVSINGPQFRLQSEAFAVYGVNYYPRDTPFERFLTETEIAGIESELDLLRAAGLNTLRIFLRYDQLFMCIGNGAVPVAAAFSRLDGLIHAAAARDLRLIMTLNHAPDLTVYPLYSRPRHMAEQTVQIVTRYRNEPAILAWDLRDRGDADYLSGARPFDREMVLGWLAESAAAIRQIDRFHALTATWETEAEVTIPVVDFVSLRHFGEADALREKVAVLAGQSEKPILLMASGFDTFSRSEEAQRDSLEAVLAAARFDNLAGWLVWTAFDFPLTATCREPDCPGADGPQNHFGLWNTSYFPKLSVDVIRAATGVE